MAGFVYRSDMHRIQAWISGVNLPNTFVWDSFAGGDIAQSNAYYFAGNMAPAIPTGGLPTPTDMTLTVAWRSDVFPLYAQFYNAAQNGVTGTVSVTPLNPNGISSVNPITYTGLYISCTKPQFQAAASTVDYLTVVLAPNVGVS